MFSLADLYHIVVDGQWKGRLQTEAGEELNASLCCEADALMCHGEITWQHGDRIVVRAHNDMQTLATILAAWKNGLVVIPVKDDMNDDAIERIASDSNAKALWQQGQYVSFASYEAEESTFISTSVNRVTGSDLALIIYTSGSTGLPKGIMLSHQNVMTSLASISQYLRLTIEDHILCLSPLSFDYGLYQVLFALYCGCTTTLYTQAFNPIQILKTLDTHAISVLPLVPAMASSLVRVIPLVKPNLMRFRAITNTGGHLSESVIKQWKSQCDHLQVYAMYGLTECKRAMYLEPELWQEKLGSVGKPIPGLDAKVFLPMGDGRYQEAKTNEVGELYVRGSAVMQGYYNPNAQGGAQIISGRYRDDNWMATGDLFSQDEDGYFYFKGRSKDLIKQAGFCLYPKDIENLIDNCPQVHLSAVMGGEDKTGSEIAMAIIELNENGDEQQALCKAWIKSNIDPDYTPRIIKFTEKISLTPNRKVDKKKLSDELTE